MCGIAGIVRLDGGDLEPAVLHALTSRLAHRGPDGDGFHVDGPVGLGHRRLAIIDPEGGAEPLGNEDGSVQLTFNGEIYNFRELRRQLQQAGHRFVTDCDAEVVVHGYEEWGDEVVDRLGGMFAFAIWDARRRRLLLARDRMGIKPLCWYRSGDTFAFASELQAFEALPDFDPELDLQALDLYLHLQYIPAPWSIHREVRKLPPAHRLVVDVDRGEVGEPRRWWDMAFEPDDAPTEDEWIERLDAALRESVAAHMISDVPFGAFLSGGVDSSSVVAYMQTVSDEPVRTFTVGFDEEGFDERGPALEVATTLGTRHHETVARLDAVELVSRLVEHFGEPFADSSAVPTWIVSRAAREHVKMVLSGDGGDELFAGYHYFGKMVRRHELDAGLVRRSRRAAGNLARAVGLVPPLPTVERSWYQRTTYFDETRRGRLWRPELRGMRDGVRSWHEEQFRRAGDGDVLSRCQQVDLTTYLPYDNLAKVDIASMAHGLEVRVPLLDHRLVELVATIPWRLRLGLHRDGDAVPVGKYLLKKTAGRFFRPGFFDRTKMGFSVPIHRWFSGPFSGELEARLTAPEAGLGDLFDLDYVRGLVREHAAGATHGWRLWSLLFLAEWRARRRRAAPVG